MKLLEIDILTFNYFSTTGNGIVRPVTYSLVSALIGTQSVLQSKCFAELVKSTVNGENQFKYFFTYFVIVNFVCGLSFWLYRMNAALKMFDGLIIIPLLQCFWTTCAILQGGVFFQEFLKFTPLQTFFFLLGVLVVFIGVFLLTPQPKEIDGVALLPTDSERSLMGSALSTSNHSSSTAGEVPDAFTTTSKNSLMHGLHPQHSFSNSGLSVRNIPSHYKQANHEKSTTLLDDTSHSLFSLTFIPVVVERLEPVHRRRSRSLSIGLGDIAVSKKKSVK